MEWTTATSASFLSAKPYLHPCRPCLLRGQSHGRAFSFPRCTVIYGVTMKPPVWPPRRGISLAGWNAPKTSPRAARHPSAELAVALAAGGGRGG